MTTEVLNVAGQSNALGFNVAPGELPAWYAPTAAVQIWTGSGWATMQPGVNTGTPANPTAWGPEVAYAHAWVQDHSGATLYVVKTVKGSTGLAQDTGAQDWSPFSTGELFDANTSALSAAKATLSGALHTTVLWFQGEEDATDAGKAAAYATNLANLKAAAATSWGADEFVVGRISTTLAHNATVQAAQGADAFNTDDAAKQLDGLHFNGVGQLANGFNFYASANDVALSVADGGAGDGFFIGSTGADSVSAMDGNDVAYGGPNADWLHGNKGDDTVSGGAGNDYVYGGQGNDFLTADDGDDYVNGNIGADYVSGGRGNDWVYGGQDNDTLNGGAGNDFLAGDRGNDVVTGGDGADAFYFFADCGADTVTDFNRAAGDYVQLEAGTTYSVAQVGADVVVTFTGGSATLAGVDLSSLGSGWII